MARSLPRVLALLLLLGVFACAEEERAPGPPQIGDSPRGITNGAADLALSHDAVVALILGNRLCSGTLITSSVALTAAHCIIGMTPEETRVGVGHDIRGDEMLWYGVVELLSHPDYDPELLVNDIGLVRIAEPIRSGVTPIPPLPPRLGLTDQDLGAILTFAGFGAESGERAASNGTRLQVSDQIDLLCPGPAACLDGTFTASPRMLCYDQQPGGPCSGDSGGPAFIVRGGREYVAGITSYGDAACETFGCSTRVDAFSKFITDFTGEPDGASLPQGAVCGANEQCASSYCIDGRCCDTACEGAPCRRCARTMGAAADGVCTPVESPCDDGDRCTEADACRAGTCRGDAVVCASETPCHVGLCDPNEGCVFEIAADGVACDDSDDRTAGDRCRGGLCIGTPTREGVAYDSGSGCGAAGKGSPSGWVIAAIAALLGAGRPRRPGRGDSALA